VCLRLPRRLRRAGAGTERGLRSLDVHVHVSGRLRWLPRQLGVQQRRERLRLHVSRRLRRAGAVAELHVQPGDLQLRVQGHADDAATRQQPGLRLEPGDVPVRVPRRLRHRYGAAGHEPRALRPGDLHRAVPARLRRLRRRRVLRRDGVRVSVHREHDLRAGLRLRHVDVHVRVRPEPGLRADPRRRPRDVLVRLRARRLRQRRLQRRVRRLGRHLPAVAVRVHAAVAVSAGVGWGRGAGSVLRAPRAAARVVGVVVAMSPG